MYEDLRQALRGTSGGGGRSAEEKRGGSGTTGGQGAVHRRWAYLSRRLLHEVACGTVMRLGRMKPLYTVVHCTKHAIRSANMRKPEASKARVWGEFPRRRCSLKSVRAQPKSNL